MEGTNEKFHSEEVERSKGGRLTVFLRKKGESDERELKDGR